MIANCSSRLAAVLMVGFCFAATAALAQMSDYEREKIEVLLYAPSIEKNPAIFDGKAFNTEADLDAAHKYMVGFVNGMNKAVRAINGMSSPARSSEAGQKLIAEAQDKLAYSKAMTAAFHAFEAAKKSATSATPAASGTVTETASESGSASSGDGLSDEQRASIQDHLDALDRLMASGIYDGEAFDASLSWEEAETFKRDFFTAANAAANAYNALPADAQRAPGGKELVKVVQDRLNDARRLNGALSNHRVALQRKENEAALQRQAEEKAAREAEARAEAEREQLEAEEAAEAAAERAAARAELAPACNTFAEEVMTRRNKRRMQAFLSDPEASGYDFKDMAKFLKAAEKIAAGCAKPDYAAIREHGCADDPLEDPKAWCEAASGAKATLRARIVRPLPNWRILAEHRYQNEDELDDQDGWVTVEGPTTLENALSFDRMMYVNTVDFGPDEQRELFTALEVTPEDYPYYEDTMDMIDELREAIEDGAGGWPEAPRAAQGEDTNYGTELAAKLIVEQWHEDAEVEDAWLGRASWKIHKNELGIILRRTLPGYVLFKLPKDPYCQLRSFTLTEQYTGSGAFQSAKGVRFGYVRFQSCERR